MAATIFNHRAGDRREVAVTFDDLPLQPPIRETEAVCAITRKLLGSLAANDVRAVGFVNEGELYEQGVLNEARVSVLRMWVEAGHELGNHTFSHSDLNTSALHEYLDDITRGELVTRGLLRQRGMAPSYFRHPFLHTGADADTRRVVEAFLSERGYEVAPVTVASQEWAFARVYDEACRRGDRGVMRRVRRAYIPYMEKVFEHAESASAELFGYEMRQVLLLHASALNADYFDRLARMLKGRGYRFITLSRALEDEAFASPDTYVGPYGLSWFYRWAAGADKRVGIAPREPEFVMSLLDQFGL
jgi:peptidoglycan/xylan/chitin deacetylase (PgdA/CDA1 family)